MDTYCIGRFPVFLGYGDSTANFLYSTLLNHWCRSGTINNRFCLNTQSRHRSTHQWQVLLVLLWVAKMQSYTISMSPMEYIFLQKILTWQPELEPWPLQHSGLVCEGSHSPSCWQVFNLYQDKRQNVMMQLEMLSGIKTNFAPCLNWWLQRCFTWETALTVLVNLLAVSFAQIYYSP